MYFQINVEFPYIDDKGKTKTAKRQYLVEDVVIEGAQRKVSEKLAEEGEDFNIVKSSQTKIDEVL